MPPLHKYKNKDIKVAFKSDCEKLLNEFQNLKSFNFQDFAPIWRNFKFSCVYTEFETDKEHLNFAEIAFFSLKKYVTFKENPYAQVGAFYILYGMYYKQPISGMTKIRLTLEEYQIISDLIQEMKDAGNYDPVYIFSKMKYDDAFQYVYLDTVLAPDLKYYSLQFKKNNDVFENSQSASLEKAFQSLVESNLVEIEKVDDEYRKCLNKFKVSSGESSLQTFDTNPAKEIREVSISGESEINKKIDNTVMEKRRAIRKKAVTTKNPSFRSKYNMQCK